nr:hypothetical protein [Actinomyces israelii]
MPRVRARAPGPAVLYARELASALQDVGAPLDSADGTSKSSAPPQSGPVMLRLSGVSARRDRRPAGALSGGTQQKLNVAWPSSTPRTCCSSTSPTRASTPWPTRTCGR